MSGNLFCDISDHLPNFLLYGHKNDIQSTKIRPLVRIYSSNNLNNFKTFITDKDSWKTFYDIPVESSNELCEEFIRIIKTAHDTNFFLKMVSRKRIKDKKWATSGIKRSSLKKNQLYRQYLRQPNEKNKDVYHKYSNIFRKTCRAAKEKYYQDLIENSKNSVKSLWSTFSPIINTRKKREHNIKIS